MNVYEFTDIGPSKSYNEDAILTDPDMGIFIQADGMSSRGNGKKSSGIAVSAAYDFLKSAKDLTKKISLKTFKQAFFEAQRRLHTSMELQEIGTTLDILLIQDNSAFLGHIGDSRVYHASNGQLKQLTVDHTDSLGVMQNFLGADGLHIDLSKICLKDRDTLLMCTDGIHKYASESVVRRAMLSANPPEYIGQEIVTDVQNLNKELKIATDNMSLIVLRHTKKETPKRTKKTYGLPVELMYREMPKLTDDFFKK